MQSVVASSRSNGSTISQANTGGGGGGLTEHDYIGLSEASSSSQTGEYRPAAAQRLGDCNGGFGETDLKLGLSLAAGCYKGDNLGYGPEKTFHWGPTQAQSQVQCQWVCQDGADRSYPLPPPPPPPPLKASQDEYQWCAAAAGQSGCNEKGGSGGWPRGFEHWVPQDRSSPSSQSAWQGQVLRGREGARILTAQDLQAPSPPPPSLPSITQDVVEGVRSGYGFANPGRVTMPPVARTKRIRNESVEPDGLHDTSTNPKGQVVGWPPIKSYRKNTLASQPKPAGEVGQEEGVPSSKSVQNQGSSLYVKVKMDGVSIGRKVDLNAHGSYETLALALEDMFHRSSGQCGAQAPMEKGHPVVNDSKPSRLLDSSSEYVLTYEDREGDWMLVGDVPWRMFVSSVKRLRIMKTSEGNGLAPRCSEKMNRQKSKAV